MLLKKNIASSTFLLDCINKILIPFWTNASNIYVINFDGKLNHPVTRYVFEKNYLFSKTKPNIYIMKLKHYDLVSILATLEKHSLFNPRAKYFVITDKAQHRIFNDMVYYNINKIIILEETPDNVIKVFNYEPYKKKYSNTSSYTPIQIGLCVRGNIIGAEETLVDATLPRLENTSIYVGYSYSIPSIILGNGKPTSGIDIDIFNLFANRFKLKIFYKQVDDFIGIRNNLDSTFNGALGALQRREVDAVVGGLFATSDSSICFDLSYPTVVNHYAWIIPSAKLRPFWKRMIYTFELPVWISFFITLGIILILLVSSNRFVTRGSFFWQREMFILYTMCLTSIGVIKRLSLRSRMILFVTWYLFLIVYSNCFSAKLLSNLMKKKYEYQINSKSELLEGTKWKICMFSDLAENLNLLGYNRVIVCDNCELCTNKTAFQGDLISIRSWNFVNFELTRLYVNEDGEPLIFRLDQTFLTVHDGAVFQKNHPLFAQFNELVLQITTTGLADQIRKKYLPNELEEPVVVWRSLKFFQLSFIFHFLAYGLTIGLSLFIFEMILLWKNTRVLR